MNLKLMPATGLLLLACCGTAQNNTGEKKSEPGQVLTVIEKVNDYWQRTRTNPGWAFWDVAVYHTGNMAAYEITGNSRYKAYSEKWANKNKWMGATSKNKAEWRYNYGETNRHVLFGDWQVCFQTYIDLYNLDTIKQPQKIARVKEVLEYQMSTLQKDYWWWADGLYMVMPVMTKMYKLTQDTLYLEKMAEYFKYANSIMYDPVEKLYFRDVKYVYPKHKTVNGKKDFWARGNGWVFAALAKVLTDLPKTDQHRKVYMDRFADMAATIKNAQQSEGYWTRSMLDPRHAPGPETSGTAFFTYGFLWGINNGVLDSKEYWPVALRAWNYIADIAIQPDGKVGYVQPIGERAIPGQIVDKNATASFGVGAVLLAAAEMHKHGDLLNH